MLRASTWLLAVLAGALALPAVAAPSHPVHIPAYVAAAVANPTRPAKQRRLDPFRKPAVVVTFAGVKPGETVAELVPAGGYYTRILSKVVGPTGHIYALVPTFPLGPPLPKHSMGKPAHHGMGMGMGMGMHKPRKHMHMPNGMAMEKALARNPEYSNVTVYPLEMSGGFHLPVKVDMVWTTLNYHDLHNVPHTNIEVFDKEVYDALKPGGIFFVVDHAAAPGAGDSVTWKLHRIDPVTARHEIEAVGFKFAGSSNALRNPHDNHLKIVFAPSIRWHTDRFIYKFRKP